MQKEENNKNQALKERRDLREVYLKEEKTYYIVKKSQSLQLKKKEALLEAQIGTKGKVEELLIKQLTMKMYLLISRKKIFMKHKKDLKSLDNTIKNYDKRIKE